jgi:hypothetical protein
MAKQTIIDSEFVSLWYHPEKKIVHHKIKQFVSGDPFRAFLMAGTDLMRKHGATKWLSDDRDCPVVRPEDIEWGDAVWFPETAACGWKHWAIVQPAKTVGQVVVKDLAAKYAKAGVASKWFADPNDALWWLERQ